MQRDETREVVIQGDVMLAPITDVPAGWDEVAGSRHVLALGESTGHAHVLEGATLLRGEAGERVVVVGPDAALRHEDHGPIAVAPGAYRVIQQTEPDLQNGFRNVAD